MITEKMKTLAATLIDRAETLGKDIVSLSFLEEKGCKTLDDMSSLVAILKASNYELFAMQGGKTYQLLAEAYPEESVAVYKSIINS